MSDLGQQLLRELGSATTANSILSTLYTIAGDTAVAAFDDPLLRTQLANTILSGMKKHHMVEGVQDEACRALGILAKNYADMQTSIAQHADGIATILKAMQNHETAQGVQERACELLRILTYKNVGNTVPIAQHGGIDSVLAAMQATRPLRFGVGVQKEACGALLNLAVHKGNRKLIAAKGGIDTLLSVMCDFPHIDVVQLYGCCTLLILTRGNTDNQKFIVENGGTDAIERAVLMHNECSLIQDVGRKTLALLKGMADAIHPARQLVPQLGPPASADRVVSALKSFQEWVAHDRSFDLVPTQLSLGDAINAVVAAMQNHETVAGVQKYGCSALNFLLYAGYTVCPRRADLTCTISAEQREAVIDASLTAMRNHTLVVHVQEEACLLLRNLGKLSVDRRDNRKLIGQKGGIDSILRAMRNHGRSVQNEACAALYSLANDRDNSILIGQKDGIDAILAAMWKYPMDPHLQSSACDALGKLTQVLMTTKNQS